MTVKSVCFAFVGLLSIVAFAALMYLPPGCKSASSVQELELHSQNKTALVSRQPVRVSQTSSSASESRATVKVFNIFRSRPDDCCPCSEEE